MVRHIARSLTARKKKAFTLVLVVGGWGGGGGGGHGGSAMCGTPNVTQATNLRDGVLHLSARQARVSWSLLYTVPDMGDLVLGHLRLVKGSQ